MTGKRANGTARQRDYGTAKKHRRSQAFSGIPRRSQLCEAVRYRAWLIREFRENREFRDVRAMPATNQVSDVLPLNRAARSLTSLNSLISLNSLLTARYRHTPKRGSLASEWCRCGAKSKFGWMGVYLAYIPIQTNELGAADAPLSRQAITTRAWCQKGAECYTRQKCRRWVVLERTSH